MSVKLFLLKKEVTESKPNRGFWTSETKVTPIGVYVSEELANEVKDQMYKELEQTREAPEPVPFAIAMGEKGNGIQRKVWVKWDMDRYHAKIPTKFIVEPIPLFK